MASRIFNPQCDSSSEDLLANKDLVDIDYSLLAKQNFLSNYWNDKQSTVIFFLETTLEAIKSNRSDIIYKPVFKNIGDARSLCSKYSWGSIKKNIVKYVKNKSDDDVQFYKNNSELYEFIVFSLYASPISFNRVSLIKPKISYDSMHALTQETVGQEIFQFKVEHLPEKEEQFAEKKKSNGSCFLYHGSKIENWYSILKNGIKNCSNNEYLKLNGSAHGEGVYLSDNMGTSYTYAVNYTSDSSNSRVIAVFEVLGNKELYKKTSGIYVVKDSNKLILRYIIRLQIPDTLIGNIGKEFNNYFNKLSFENRPTQKQKTEINAKKHSELVGETAAKNTKSKKEHTSRINRRLMKELKDIDKIPSELGISVIVDECNVRLWKCYLSNFDENTPLGKDMLEKNVNKIELELRIPDNYPFDPPFIRVVYPRFMFHTGHITLGGSICMELLTSQGWSPSYCIENLLTQIKAQLIVGDGQLDTHKWTVPYSFKEAQDAFRRVAIQHGWMR